MNLHDKILNIKPREFRYELPKSSFVAAHKEGHREARHAAAELALEADALLEKHRDLLRMVVAYARECGYGWMCLSEADFLLGDDVALKSTVGIERLRSSPLE